MGDTITITRVEYEALKRDSSMLSALEAAGVDNWDGYDNAIQIWKENMQIRPG